MTGFDTDRLADLLALIDTDRWRSRPADQAQYLTEMIGRAGQRVTTELVVAVGADVAAWAAHCGATTVEEAARRFQDAVDVDMLADCLGRLDGLPDSLTVEARPAAAEQPAPETIEAPAPGPVPQDAAEPKPEPEPGPGPDVVPPVPVGEEGALEAAARVLFASFSPSPDWTGAPESLRRRYRRQAGEIVAAYLAARPTPDH